MLWVCGPVARAPARAAFAIPAGAAVGGSTVLGLGQCRLPCGHTSSGHGHGRSEAAWQQCTHQDRAEARRARHLRRSRLSGPLSRQRPGASPGSKHSSPAALLCSSLPVPGRRPRLVAARLCPVPGGACPARTIPGAGAPSTPPARPGRLACRLRHAQNLAAPSSRAPAGPLPAFLA